MSRQLYKTIFEFFKRNHVGYKTIVGLGTLEKDGSIYLDRRFLKENGREKVVTALHEFIHLDRGHHNANWPVPVPHIENEIDTLAYFLYENNPVIVSYIRKHIEESVMYDQKMKEFRGQLRLF